MTAPIGSKQLVVNTLFSVSNSDMNQFLNDKKNDNYVLNDTNEQKGYVPPDNWERFAGGLRIENVLDPLMQPYRNEIPAGSYNVVVLAGDNDAGNGNGVLKQSISLERGGEVTLTFYSIRNPYKNKTYNCLTGTNQFSVTFGPNQSQKYVDFCNGVAWAPRTFNSQFSEPGSYDLSFGPGSGQVDSVHQDCSSVIAYPQMNYTYAAYATLKAPSSLSDITAAPNDPFPEIDVLILEGNENLGAPGTILPKSQVVFQIKDDGGTGTLFKGGATRYPATANDNGVATIPGGELVAGQTPGNVTLDVLVADDVAATLIGAVHADFPPDGETLVVNSPPPPNVISMAPLSRYENSIIFEDQIQNDGNGIQGVSNKLIHVEIRQNDELVDNQNDLYFEVDDQHVIEWQGTTSDDDETRGTLTTPPLRAGATAGTYQIVAYLDGYPKCKASVQVGIKGVDHFDPLEKSVKAIRNTDVIGHWSVTALDSAGNPATAQHINFTINTKPDSVDASFLVSGTHQTTSVSNPETGGVTVPPLSVTDASGSFDVVISDASNTASSTITVEVIDPQYPGSIAFDNAPPDLTNAAGTILKEGKIGVYVWVNFDNNVPMISGRLNLTIDDTGSTGTTFCSGNPPKLSSDSDIIDGYAQVPAIRLGGTPGTFKIIASMDQYDESPSLTLKIGPK
ncbi:invasin/intimin cell-adhesion domain protein [Burkholderia sp. D-99]|uniref:invasin/intimin cell-adhesion domain protein n=1 Tax=Burkholderia sp. D-99 TaxID=2717316 RepID=UPI001AA11A63|nr:invasin/intimin cell-adhesion domain protein [Burkholderia sp. D-99]